MRYHFVVRDGARIEHEDGAVLPDDEAARVHAVRIICVLQADEAIRGSYTMQVVRDGRLVWCTPFAISYALLDHRRAFARRSAVGGLSRRWHMDRRLREVIALSGFSAVLCAVAFSFNDIVATAIF